MDDVVAIDGFWEALNTVRSYRCNCWREDGSPRMAKGSFNMDLPACQHVIKQESVNGKAFALALDVVLEPLVSDPVILERWTFKISPPEFAEDDQGGYPSGVGDLNSSLISTGSASTNKSSKTRAGSGNATQVYRKLCIMLRSLLSLCVMLPANSLFSKPSSHDIKHSIRIEVKRGLEVVALPPSLDRMQFDLRPVHGQSAAIRIGVNYVVDIANVSKLFRQPKVENVVVAKKSGIGLLFEAKAKEILQGSAADDHKILDNTDSECIKQEEAITTNVKRDEDHTEASVYSSTGDVGHFSQHADGPFQPLLRTSSNPRDIPVNPRLVRQRQAAASLPARPSDGANSFGGRTPPSSRGRGAGPWAHSPFKSPGTPPLYRTPPLVKYNSKKNEEGSGSIVAFPDKGDAAGHSVREKHHFPQSLPTRLVTLPSGQVYRSPSNSSLASLTASLASSVQLFYGGNGPEAVNTPPFAGFVSGSKSLTASTMSSASSRPPPSPSLRPTPSGSPVFSSLAGVMQSKQPPQDEIAYQDFAERIPHGQSQHVEAVKRINPFKSGIKRMPFPASLGSKATPPPFGAALRSNALEMPWFVPTERIDEISASFFESVEGLKSDALGIPLRRTSESNLSAEESLAKFLLFCEMDPNALGFIPSTGRSKTSVGELRNDMMLYSCKC